MTNVTYAVCKMRLHPSKLEYSILKRMCRLSKNIYNTSLWLINQHYEQTGEYMNYVEVASILKDDENYKQLYSSCCQQTARIVDRNVRSFFALLRKKNQGSYNRQVNFPRYLKKDSYFQVIYTGQAARVKDNKLYLGVKNTTKSLGLNSVKELAFSLPDFINNENIAEVQIHPRYNGKYFELHIVYVKETQELELSNKKLAIDLGVVNFVTAIDNTGNSFIINGNALKAINQWYNKETARLQSIYAKKNQKYGKQYYYVTRKRNSIVDNYIKQTCAFIQKHCIKEGISEVVVGYNAYWKQNTNIGRRNNQTFVNIPFGKFLICLQHKLKLVGIKYQQHEESYTSKCDALALESIEKHDTYLGKRKYRGLFQSSANRLINADINGALNIGRKVFGDGFIPADSSRVNRVAKINIAKIPCLSWY